MDMDCKISITHQARPETVTTWISGSKGEHVPQTRMHFVLV